MKTVSHHDRKDIRLKDVFIPPPGKTTSPPARVICPALNTDGAGPGATTRADTSKRHGDKLLDKTLADSFPASDPPSSGHIT